MFTNQEKVKIMIYLGHSPKLVDENSGYYNPRLTGRLNVSEDIESEVRAILGKIAALETKEDGSMSHAGVRRVDDIEFFENGGTTAQIKRQKVDLGRRLAMILDVPFCGSGSFVNVGVV